MFSCDAEDEEANEKTMMYYVNDGVYGSFNCILYDHAECLPILHTASRTAPLHAIILYNSFRAIVLTYHCRDPFPNRSQSQTRPRTRAASGGPPAMAWTASSSTAACPTCRWATGCCLRTWVPTRWRRPPTSTALRRQTSTVSCPALPGERRLALNF